MSASRISRLSCATVALAIALLPNSTWAQAVKPEADAAVKAEHSQIGVDPRHARQVHTTHPGAQWFPEAGFGLFIHWGLSSVRAMNISWPMIPGRPLAAKRIEDPTERARIVRESDYNLDGKPPAITPNQYWAMARDFDPQAYDPDKWLAAAKEAGFTYAVLTARHHEGFALWPSAHGDFNTKHHAGGRDLVKPFVEACRRHGLKVGLYYSPPDWYFDREHMSFLYHGARRTNPELPSLDADLRPRAAEKSAEEKARHHAAYAAMVKGQVEELLTRYGTIDLLWFDGKPGIPDGHKVISLERIRELQPAIVVNPRLHGRGDFTTFERRLPAARPDVDWAEFCNTWTSSWSHQELPFRAPAFVLGQLALSRAWGLNYLLGVGPMRTGEMAEGVYRNMAIVRDWMKQNGAALRGTRPLAAGESASVPAVARGELRYLFAIPEFKAGGMLPADQLPASDTKLTLSGAPAPRTVTLLATGKPLAFTQKDGVLTVSLPATLRSTLVDVVLVQTEN